MSSDDLNPTLYDPDATPSEPVRPTTFKFTRPPQARITPQWGDILETAPQTLTFTLVDFGEEICLAFNGELLIGRGGPDGGQPDLDLSGYDAYRYGVSRHHAAIWYDADTLKLVDLGSTNGTYLNGTRLIPQMLAILRDGDTIVFGTFQVRISVR